MSKHDSLLAKANLIMTGNAAVNAQGVIVDAREHPVAIPVPKHAKRGAVVLAIMQNQWLKDAAYHQRRFEGERAKDIAHWRKLWRRTVAYALFAGCHSGRVLRKHLGEDLTGRIVWEESTRVITASPSECPPADLEHVRETIEDVRPAVIITFGKIASAAVDAVLEPGITGTRRFNGDPLTFIQSPHPAARGAGMQEGVREACVALLNAIGEYR